MSRVLCLFLIVCFLQGCFVANDVECFLRFFPTEGGFYSTSDVPDQYLAVGDTLFLDVNSYWDYGYQCEDYGTEPSLNSLIIQSGIAELHRQGNSVFIVGKEAGSTEAMIIGSAYVRRDNSDEIHPVVLTVNIQVGTQPGDPKRQRAVFPPTGRVDSIIVSGEEYPEQMTRLTAVYSPEVVINDYLDLRSQWGLYTRSNTNLLKPYGSPLFTEYGDRFNYVSLKADTLGGRYYGYVQIITADKTYGRTFHLDF